MLGGILLFRECIAEFCGWGLLFLVDRRVVFVFYVGFGIVSVTERVLRKCNLGGEGTVVFGVRGGKRTVLEGTARFWVGRLGGLELRGTSVGRREGEFERRRERWVVVRRVEVLRLG